MGANSSVEEDEFGGKQRSEDLQEDLEEGLEMSWQKYQERRQREERRRGPVRMNNTQQQQHQNPLPSPQGDDLGPIMTGQNAGKIKASLGLMLEKGICEMSASASLQVLPSDPTISSTEASGFNDLPQSAKDIYYQNYGKDQASKEFFNDQWHYVELHHSVLQESSQVE